MANSKIFRSAQNRSPGGGSPTDGYLNFSQAIQQLKKSQIRKVQPYNLIREIAGKIRQPTSKLFFKVLFTNTSGQFKLFVVVGSNTNQALAGAQFFVVGNLIKNKIDSVVRINRNQSSRSVSAANKSQKDGLQKRRKSAPKGNTRSVRFRKKRRSISRRARLRARRRPPVKDSLVIENIKEVGIEMPMQFDTPAGNVPKKDFASIFEDANLSLYNVDSSDEVQIENPPGVAKFIGLGVANDRPTVIASTDLSLVGEGDDEDNFADVYNQLLLDRTLRLEAVYQNLELLESEETDTVPMEELLQELKLLTEDAVSSVAVISQLDDQIIREIAIEMQDLAKILGFAGEARTSTLYSQILSDIGLAPFIGTFEGENRKLNVPATEINVDQNYATDNFSGYDIYKALGNGTKDATDPSSYHFGRYGTLLGFTSNPSVTDAVSMANSASESARNAVYAKATTIEDIHSVMNAIYAELVLSRLFLAGDTNVAKIQGKSKNISTAFLGDFADPATTLSKVSVPTDLASIIRFNSGGENYYALEESLPSESGISGRTFLDAVVQPAVGNIIEGEDPNFDLLNKWIEQSTSSLSDFEKYIDAMYTNGGAPIIINEIVLNLLTFLTDSTAKIGSTKHPLSNRMSRIDESEYDSTEERIRLIKSALVNMSSNKTYGMAHVYNTIGQTYFKHQDYMIHNEVRYTYGVFYQPGNYTKLKAYNLGSTSGSTYKPTKDEDPDRDIGDSQYITRVLNTYYEEAARYFSLLENNIMTNIDILMSDLGLIDISAAPQYNVSNMSNFFVEKAATNKAGGLANNEKPGAALGTYQATAFSGIPLIYLRSLLAGCTSWLIGIYDRDSSLNWLATEEDMVKAAKVAVTNIDPEVGPVRWKVTRGPWPPESGDYDDLDDEFYNSLVPTEVREAFEGGAETEIEFDSDGNPTSISVEDPTEGWDFIQSQEGFCPLTLILDGEDNPSNDFSLVRGNRGAFDEIYDNIMVDRIRVHKMKEFLNKPVTAFSNFPLTLEESIGELSLDSLVTLAELPGIDGQALVKFTSKNQIYNMKKAQRLEEPSSALRFIPNKHIVGDPEFKAARTYLGLATNELSDPEKSIIQTVGIPTGLLSSSGLESSVFSLSRDAEYMFFANYSFSTKRFLFHPSIYLIPGSFTNINDGSKELIVKSARYYVVDDRTSQFMSYGDVQDYFELGDTEAFEIMSNHVLDFSIKLVKKLTTGMDLSEDTFRIDGLANQLYVSADGLKNIETIMTKFPEGYADIFNETSIKTPKQILATLTDSTVAEINNFKGSLECRLITPEEIAKKVLSPRIFDRVFCIIAHPDHHYTNQSTRGLKRVTVEIDGQEREVYQINLADAGANEIYNDHFASYYYRVVKS